MGLMMIIDGILRNDCFYSDVLNILKDELILRFKYNNIDIRRYCIVLVFFKVE